MANTLEDAHMEKQQHNDELQVSQDIEFQRRSWTVQRIGWIGIGLIVLAALAGLFGGGPVSQAHAGSSGDPIEIAYPRFGRLLAPTTLNLQLNQIEGPQARVWIDRALLEDVRVEHVEPEPGSIEAGSDRLIYVFDLADGHESTSVTFFIEPQTVGWLNGRVGIENGAELTFSPLIYP
jgi:hypothetical protein